MTSILLELGHSVLGIDVGWSEARASTGLCLLTRTRDGISAKLKRVGIDPIERVRTLESLTEDVNLDGVGIDGQLVRELRITNRYRPAEALLSRGSFQKRGKAGPTNSDTGAKLHAEATWWGRELTQRVDRKAPIWAPAESCVVEAFPSQFLAVLHPENEFPTRPTSNRNWTGVLLPTRPIRGAIENLMESYAGTTCVPWNMLATRTQDERDAFICALTALCVLGGSYTIVGDDELGHIVLPPRRNWGENFAGTMPWAEAALKRNLASVRLDQRFSDLDPKVTYEDG
jgi:predicted RNase H-like nuclease